MIALKLRSFRLPNRVGLRVTGPRISHCDSQTVSEWTQSAQIDCDIRFGFSIIFRSIINMHDSLTLSDTDSYCDSLSLTLSG
jgi:hypothetical protein